ncbi:hypothetical protein BC826DRAFT_214229 [Russula brevipes]|nr:hypothetical protein BC826DRAFT_214229 [Russula brevipes]
MPGPAVYVAVAIGAVAAAIAFKELVYDPHFRPRISAWREGTRRRQRARPHVYTASSSSPPPEGDDVARTSPRRDTHRKEKYPRRPVESTKHIELQHVIASEVESLKSSAEADGENRGIRQRRIGESQNLCDHPVENVSHFRSPKVDFLSQSDRLVAVRAHFGLKFNAAAYRSRRPKYLR